MCQTKAVEKTAGGFSNEWRVVDVRYRNHKSWILPSVWVLIYSEMNSRFYQNVLQTITVVSV